jgi:hypothetical protein
MGSGDHPEVNALLIARTKRFSADDSTVDDMDEDF